MKKKIPTTTETQEVNKSRTYIRNLSFKDFFRLVVRLNERHKSFKKRKKEECPEDQTKHLDEDIKHVGSAIAWLKRTK
jgi:hypothetical protein